jgi:hypothetical protein
MACTLPSTTADSGAAAIAPNRSLRVTQAALSLNTTQDKEEGEEINGYT